MKLGCVTILMFNLIQLNNALYPPLVNIRYEISETESVSTSPTPNISAVCKSKDRKCIWKCCPSGMHMMPKKKCVPSNISFSDITVYDSLVLSTEKSFESVFQLVPGLLTYELFLENSFRTSIIAKTYLVEDGTLYMEFPNRYHRWSLFKTDSFCVDMLFTRKAIKPIFLAEALVEPENFDNIIIYNDFALCITIGFLLLTVLPYCILPRLRDNNGLILIIFIVLFSIPMVIRLYLLSLVTTILATLITGILHYFTFTSSICWTNVMFYRILKSERNHLNDVKMVESRKRELFKYCIYTFGLPLLLTTLVIVTEISDLRHLPWVIVTPKIIETNSVLVDGAELLYYLYIPVMLLLMFNWIICITNVIHFCKKIKMFPMFPLGIGSNILKSPLDRTAQYVKLLVLLTVYCVLKAVAILSPNTDINYDTHCYFVMCIGPVTFITFVIDKSVWKMTKDYIAKFKNSSMKFQSVFYIKNGDVILLEK